MKENKGNIKKRSKPKKEIRPARSKVKHPNLTKTYVPRVRREFMDQDYLKTLNEDEIKWLNKFMGEFYGANLDFKNLKNNIHKTKKAKKECTDRNNRQNNDLYGVTKSVGLLESVEYYPETDYEGNPNVTETMLIEYIDRNRGSKKPSDSTSLDKAELLKSDSNTKKSRNKRT